MSSKPEQIEFECPKCQNRLKTATQNAGKRIRCSNCKNGVTVPLDDIDFDFHIDIDDVIAKAQSKPNIEVVAINARLKDDAKSGPAAPEKPLTNTKKVVSNKQLPEKKRLLKEAKRRRARDINPNPADDPGTTHQPPADDSAPKKHGRKTQVNNEDLDKPAPIPEPNLREEEDLSPIHVEGITSDSVDPADLYGVKCEICDTRIHVTQDMVDSFVECPVCFTKVRVTPPKQNSKLRPKWMGPAPCADSPGDDLKTADENRPTNSDSQFKLSDPIELPEINPDHGFPEVEKDLLAPLQGRDDDPSEPPVEDSIPELEIVKSDTSSPPEQIEPGSGSKKASLRERFEQSYEDESEAQKPLSVHTEKELEPLTFKSLNELISNVLRNPAVLLRAALAIVFLTVGVFLYHQFEGTMSEDAESGFANTLSILLFGSLYFAVYGTGLIWLWYVCSYVFRDTARGLRGVESFGSSGVDELKSTFLLFAFSFAVAGSPFLMLPSFVSAPLRMIIAPLLLIVAWFNQSAFIGIAFEPFATMRTEPDDWKHFYIYVLGIAVVSSLGGLFYLVPYGAGIGATVSVATTLAFSAITGWHCGRMIKKTEEII